MRVLAVDWSGALTGAHKKIWLAEASGGNLVRLESGRGRDETADLLLAEAAATPGLVVGLDFAFSLPAWFLAERDLRNAQELWALVDREGEAWLRECRPPFWGRPGACRPLADGLRDQLRHTEQVAPNTGSSRPKSVFQIGGAGAVGTGSLRGMRLLNRLHANGFSVWPFDPPGWPRVVEIYPRLLTGPVVKSSRAACEDYLRGHHPGLGARWLPVASASEDAFDAAVSALMMAEHVDSLCDLPRADSEVISQEGLIWYPGWERSAL